MKYPDRSNAGRSKLVPYIPGEAPMDRHDRRLRSNLERVDEVHRFTIQRGITLRICNGGHHWIFSRGDNFFAEWWPSSAKLVFSHRYHEGIHIHDHLQLIRHLERRL